MEVLTFILVLIIGFVIIRSHQPRLSSSLTLLHIRTKYLRPEVSIVELIILTLCIINSHQIILLNENDSHLSH